LQTPTVVAKGAWLIEREEHRTLRLLANTNRWISPMIEINSTFNGV
jgi:hypothetical protein